MSITTNNEEIKMQGLEIDIKLLKEYIQLEKVILFGNLEANANDYDLIIISEDFKNMFPKKRKEIVSRTIQANKKLDLMCYTKSDYDKIKEKNSVLKKGVTIYDREKKVRNYFKIFN